jgi:preprotein translocase subunit SecF
MLKPVRFVPRNPKLPFTSLRKFSFALSALMVLGSFISVATIGLNFGIDFKGGIVLEIRTEGPADIGGLRADLGALSLGEVSIQEFGDPQEVLIRVQRQEGEEREQIAAIDKIKTELGDTVEYRRTEFVGPTVGAELIEAGIWAVTLALLSILVYVWFRFEWQFSVAAIAALTHDVITTIGLFALIQHEFNLATVAAVLTIAGYSINDTVVIFDRVRENLRRYKTMELADLLDLSNNGTLSRTFMTSGTTLLALIAIYFFGGPVLADFALALIWGIVVGTYSSLFVAVPLLLYTGVRRGGDEEQDESGLQMPEYERTDR